MNKDLLISACLWSLMAATVIWTLIVPKVMVGLIISGTILIVATTIICLLIKIAIKSR